MPAKFTDPDIRDAREAADVVALEKSRPCLPGRLLPPLITRFRGAGAEARACRSRHCPQRSPAQAARLAGLASSELAALRGAADALAERFTACIAPAAARAGGACRG